MFSDQVFVFTPNVEVFDLPQNATPVDFAYRDVSGLKFNTEAYLCLDDDNEYIKKLTELASSNEKEGENSGKSETN